MKSEQLEAAEMLVRYSSLSNLPALKNSEIIINQIDWEKIEQSELSKQEWVLVEILRFILLRQSSARIADLLLLSDLDLHAVLLALNPKYFKEDL